MWFANLRNRWKISKEKCCATCKPTGILEACVIASITTPLVILPLLFEFLSHQPDRTMWSMAPPRGMYTVSLCVAWTTLNHPLNFTSPLQQVSWSTPGGTSFGQLCVVFCVVSGQTWYLFCKQQITQHYYVLHYVKAAHKPSLSHNICWQRKHFCSTTTVSLVTHRFCTDLLHLMYLRKKNIMKKRTQ